MVAIGATSSFIVDISGVGVVDTILYRDSAGIGQRLWGGAREIHHFPVGVEGREVHWNIRAKVFYHPLGHFFNFIFGIVFSRD